MSYALRRLLGAVPLLLGISLIAFVLIRLAPGDPVGMLYGPDEPIEDIARVRASLGLDQPLPVQYLAWLRNVLRGDLGRSYSDGRPVLAVIVERVPRTLQLTLSALALALVGGLSIGALAALRRNTALDALATALATACYSIPGFWLALLLILVFSVQLRLLPSGGVGTLRGERTLRDGLAHLILPAVVLSLRELGRIVRFTRAGLLDVLESDYIRTARAKGLREHSVVWSHALRNALLPLITLLGLAVPGLLGGSIVIESVFAWPGIGRLAYEAALARNYPLIMGLTLCIGALVIIGNLLADLGYGLADPRVRLDEG
jgi:peptide/nickel transport system permease protein